MRYLIVTYDEAGLPTKDYSLFDVLGRFLTEEGLNCGLADMHAPSAVEEFVAPDQHLLQRLLNSVEIVEDELGGVPEVGEETWERLKAVWDETASMRTLIEEQMNLEPPTSPEITAIYYDEASTIPYLIPPATPIAIGEQSCDKVNS